MGTTRPSHAQAARLLAERDPVIAGLLEAVGPPRLAPPVESHFAALLRSVLYQQLAGAAAAAIHGRLLDALAHTVTPEAFLALSPEALRAAGLSRNKARSLTDLAAKVHDGTVELAPRRLGRESDEEVIARLCAVRGIGRWTAQMFLLFQLRRMDVWPTGDLGVRRGFGLAYGQEMPSDKELEPLGEFARPYRSVLAWYCWRACEVFSGAGHSALTT
ncbi:MAG: DNA-3-methyladenine glycosylase 2 family protein [Actinomycetota bacterium]|nr:DNA-3-methyladenine glycosylase 2 family protein [Actinomycetota bacterium]